MHVICLYMGAGLQGRLSRVADNVFLVVTQPNQQQINFSIAPQNIQMEESL